MIVFVVRAVLLVVCVCVCFFPLSSDFVLVFEVFFDIFSDAFSQRVIRTNMSPIENDHLALCKGFRKHCVRSSKVEMAFDGYRRYFNRYRQVSGMKRVTVSERGHA